MSGLFTVETVKARDLVAGDIFQDEYRTLYQFKANNGSWIAASSTTRKPTIQARFDADTEVYRLLPIELEPAQEIANADAGEDGLRPVWTEDPIVTLIYLLIRDHLNAGIIEELVTWRAGPPTELTNRYLAFYADSIARRIRVESENDVVSYLGAP